ncbi:MAG: hypothetical protein LBJ93_01900 [Clostridiales bacterium]|jgi:hypothetical protein|nr:hypothetical protein [Clostridiales bacterium]
MKKNNRLLRNLILSVFLAFANFFSFKKIFASPAVPSISVIETSTLIGDIMNMITQVVIIGGAFWAVWGVVVLAGGLKDKNGPALQSGIWQIVGGILIIIAAALLKMVVKF